MRMAFIDCAEAAMSCYSRKLFNQLFLESLLYLTDDSVANVRLRLGRVVPKLAHFCFGMPAVAMMIAALKIDNDPDVRDIMRGIEHKLGAIEQNREAFEAEDKRRENAEVQMRDEAMKSMAKPESLDISKSPVTFATKLSSSDACTPQVTEPCTPENSDGNEHRADSPPKNLRTSLRKADTIEEEEIVKIRRPVSPKRGLKSLRIQLGPGTGKEEREGAESLSLPKLVMSPINSPEAGNQEEKSDAERSSEKPDSPRRKGLQMLRDLGWTRKR